MLFPIFLEARPPGMRLEPTPFTVKAKDVTTGPRTHVQTICSVNTEWKQNAKGINHPNKDYFRSKQRLNICSDKITNNKSVKAKIIWQKDKVEIYYKL